MQPIRDKANKIYMIVGCHGSATSLVAQGLKRCGISIGNYIIQDVNEDRAFKNINKGIIHKAGGTWYDPPTEEAILAVDMEQEIKALLQSYEGDKWAVKDPRASLTGKQYLPHLEGDVYLFCCFRRSGRLVKSLQRKAALIEDADFVERYMHKGLVDTYNRAIVSLIEEFCEL